MIESEFNKDNIEFPKGENRLVKTQNDEHTTHIEQHLSSVQLDNLTIPTNFSEKHLNYQAHDLFTSEDISPNGTIYYISDIHLIHKIKSKLDDFSYNDVHDFIEKVVTTLTSNIDYRLSPIQGPLLIVGGDVSSDFEITKLFYQSLSSHWLPERIIAILGNHELWGFDCNLEKTIEKYRSFFAKLKISFLHNELLFVDRQIVSKNNYKGIAQTHYKLSYKQCLELDNKTPLEINKQFCATSYIIVGGLGFSGLNAKHNATIGLYGNAIKTLDQDILETSKFSRLYDSVLKHFPDRQVIVLSHTPKEDWTNLPFHKGWIYVNGHTHQNKWTDRDDVRVYEDNQLGYTSVKYHLKHFQLKNLDYDIFDYYKDGCYIISNKQYSDFNRGLGLSGNGHDCGKIHMLKRSGWYCFLFEDLNRNKLYFLNGGILNNIENHDLNYYYNNMEAFANILKNISQTRQDVLNKLSKAIIQIGGSGRIHGSIVDIDYYNHIYLNVFDGSITCYYATSITDKYIYENIPSLLKARLPRLYRKYQTLLKADSDSALATSDDIISSSSVKYISTDIYKASRIMKKLQALLNKNVIRMWDEKIFEMFTQNKKLEQ
jgi:calcineurin-like phosphoesterase family protein